MLIERREMIEKLCENIVPYIDSYVVVEDRGAPWLDNRDNYEWYFSYGATFRPNSILEVGVRYGYSLLSMIIGSKFSVKKLYLYDNEIDIPGSTEIAIQSIKKVAPEIEIIFHKVNTFDLNCPSDYEKVDLIHIDGCHRPREVRHDYDLFWKHLNPGGVMVFDDSRSLSGEKTSPLFFHLIPMFYDNHEIGNIEIVNNYSMHILLRKKLK